MTTRFKSAVLAQLAVFGVLMLPAGAAANVDLQWRMPSPIVRIRATVEVGLYAVSDDDSDQPFAAMEAILGWDPGVLELTGKVDGGPYTWSMSWFPDDSQIDGLNADCGPELFCPEYTFRPYNDGDAVYVAIAQYTGPKPRATPEGLLVTMFVFTALTVTPATELSLLETAGAFSSTKVLHADEEGTRIVTGKLGSITIPIAPCGSAGDFDGDCEVDLIDAGQFAGCLTGPGAAASGSICGAADFDGDRDVDLRDAAAFQSMFTGP